MKLTQIKYLNPSKIHFVSQCRYRYTLLLTKDRNTEKYFNKNTFLGTLMHSVVEKFLKRKISINDYEDLWKNQLSNKLKEYNIDKETFKNLIYQLPYYIIKKNKLKSYLSTFQTLEGFNLELEKDISQGCVVGIADIVFSNNEKVYLIDYKTGPIYSFLHGVKVGIKEGYKLQLLTYGYTYWKKGYKPENIYCVLQGLNVGENQTLTFTEKDYKLHEFFLENLLESINIGIEMGV